LEMTKTMAETIKTNVPSLVVAETGQIGSEKGIINQKKPAFANAVVRRAISLAMDRQAFVQGVRHGGARVGTSVMPRPYGAWGLLDQEVRTLAGYSGPRPDQAAGER